MSETSFALSSGLGVLVALRGSAAQGSPTAVALMLTRSRNVLESVKAPFSSSSSSCSTSDYDNDDNDIAVLGVQ